ncbi:MAG: hypothetical protein ACTH31_04485 [Pseudoclavibacter sp.]
MRRRLAKMFGMLGAVVVSASLLAGCGPSEPDITPLPEATESTVSDVTSPTVPVTPSTADLPLVTDAPTSEDEAIYWAIRAANAFFLVQAEVMNEHPEDTSLVDLIAKDNIADLIKSNAANLVSNGHDRSGTSYIELFEERGTVAADPDNPENDYGGVLLFLCSGTGDISVTDADGNPVEVVQNSPAPARMLVAYVPQSSSWFVLEFAKVSDADYTC